MDSGFQYDRNLSSGVNRHAMSFQSRGVGSTTEMVMMGDYYLMNSTAAGGATTSARYLGNSSVGNGSSGFRQSGNSCGSVPGLKHDAGLAVSGQLKNNISWKKDFPSRLSDEPSIMRYIKIAATLRDKTVCDVALRCRWMARKRRKQDDQHMGKKLKDKKDHLLESYSKPSIASAPTLDVAPFPVTMNNRAQIDGIAFEALSGSIRHLLEQNSQVLGQISANMSSMKLQDNINLFSHMKNNISAILNDIRYIPGPPLPVSLNKDLAHNILSTTNQRTTHQTSRGMYIKQEPQF